MSEHSILGNAVPETVLAGYSAVTANDLESAVLLAMGCPGLQDGFVVEVGKLGYAS